MTASPQPGEVELRPRLRHAARVVAQHAAQLLADLADLDVLSKEDLLNRRYQRLMTYGYA